MAGIVDDRYGRCCQYRRFRTFSIVCRATPYSFARAADGSVRDRISRTSASVNFELLFPSPTCEGGEGGLKRPRSMASRALSRAVPSRRWAGLQQAGLSQECNTKRVGSAPVAIHNDRMCAYTPTKAPVRRDRIRIWPYPSLTRQAVQGQHAAGPAERSTFAQKRAISSSRNGAPTKVFRRSSSRANNSEAGFGAGPLFPMHGA